MDIIQIDKIEDFKKFIESINVNTIYVLPPIFRYRWIKIEKANEYFSKEIYFSWTMEYNYSISGAVGYIYPLSSNSKVAHFKTEGGAKRNLLKRYKDYFDSKIQKNN
jgi:hypothetical protein